MAIDVIGEDRPIVRAMSRQVVDPSGNDTHYHLVLQPKRGISSGMRVLNGAHSRAFNARHGRRGALFESRFVDRVVRGEAHLANAVAYVEHNAVSAGMVRDPRAWPWSTHEGCALRALLAACLKGV